jgi:hypothetical protein
LTNLEGHKGITKTSNPFYVLSSEEITKMARDVGVSLGVSLNEINSSVSEKHTSDSTRTEDFVA